MCIGKWIPKVFFRIIKSSNPLFIISFEKKQKIFVCVELFCKFELGKAVEKLKLLINFSKI
jgi:hypothetical protein